MKKYIPFLLLSLFFTSCSLSVNYIGNSFEETSHVDIYVDPSAITKNYTVMGKGYLTRPAGGAFGSYERVQRAATKQARKHGADAILFTDRYYFQSGVHTANQFDTAGRRINSSTIAGPIVQNDMEIQFLKYK